MDTLVFSRTLPRGPVPRVPFAKPAGRSVRRSETRISPPRPASENLGFPRLLVPTITVARVPSVSNAIRRSFDSSASISASTAAPAAAPSAFGGAPPANSFGGGSPWRPGRVRYAFWRVSCGRPSARGERSARRQRATTATAHDPRPSIVLVEGMWLLPFSW